MQNEVISQQRSTSPPGVAEGNGPANNRRRSAGKSKGAESPSSTKAPIQALITPTTKATVLIVHSSPLVRLGLVGLIKLSERFAVCAQTDSAPIARAMFVKLQPQLVILGLTVHGGHGLELIRDFRRLNIRAVMLVLSARDDVLSIQRAFRAGARGYLTIKDDPSEVLRAFDQICAGQLYASSSVLPLLLENLAMGEIEPASSELNTLSDRELQVFSLIGRGFGASRLAHELHLSVKTIETHQMHLKEKLGLHSAAELSEKASEWMVRSARQNFQSRERILHENAACPLPLLHSR